MTILGKTAACFVGVAEHGLADIVVVDIALSSTGIGSRPVALGHRKIQELSGSWTGHMYEPMYSFPSSSHPNFL